MDPVIAERSRWGLNKLDLLGSDKLTVVTYDAARLNLSKFQTVVLAAMLPHEVKWEIINNIRYLLTERDERYDILYRAAPDDLRCLLFPQYNRLSYDSKGRRVVVTEVERSKPDWNDPIVDIRLRAKAPAQNLRGFDNLYIETENKLF